MRPTGRRTLAQRVGSEAEDAAARFLERRGLQVVARNFRTRFGEIDLVARDGASLVFVEVRLRSSARFGGGAGSIDAGKRRKVVRAARIYLSRVRPEPPCRFDVVTLDGASPQWLRGAFEVS
jgi:putative endonuclease